MRITPYSYQPLSYGTTTDDDAWSVVAAYLRREREKAEKEEKERETRRRGVDARIKGRIPVKAECIILR